MKRLKHILILTKEYQHPELPRVGGTGIFYSFLAKELVRKGFKVSVVAVTKKDISFSDDGVEVISIKSIFTRNFLWEFLRSISGKLNFLKPLHFKIYEHEKKVIRHQINNWIKKNNHQIDLIETHDFEGMALCIDEKIPYVIRCHGSWTVLENYFGYKKGPEGRLHCEKLAFEKSINIIAISQFSKSINEKFFKIQNPKIIYNGIDAEKFTIDKEVKLIPHSIFYLGNVSVEKGAEIAVRSFVKVKEIFPYTTLNFVGKVLLNKNFLDEIEHLPIPENSIIFHEEKNKSEVIKLISSAEIVYFPSKGENFSLSLLEVMALEKAVICSDIESFKEIIIEGENGLIANNVDDFYNKSVMLFQNVDLRSKLSKNARETILSKFTSERMMKETLDYYNEIL